MKPPNQSSAVARQDNARFGYSFLSPTGWIESEPTNSDGKTFVDPQNTNVEVRVYAHYAVAHNSLDSWVSWELGIDRRSSDVAIIHDIPGHLVVENHGAGEENIPARTVVYDILENDREVRVSSTFAQAGVIQYSVRCKAPTTDFAKYEQLFNLLGNGLRIRPQSGLPPQPLGAC